MPDPSQPTADELVIRRPLLKAYYYRFTATDCAWIDHILSELACAGKSFHSTSEWSDSDPGEPSCVDLIQAAADVAAKRIEALEAEVKLWRARCEHGTGKHTLHPNMHCDWCPTTEESPDA